MSMHPEQGQPSNASQEEAYRVQLDVFAGPLDLLLRLIEKRELDITTVSLAAVTDQYLDHIGRLSRLAIDDLAGFLDIASRLVLIKSRMLLPQPTAADERAEDVGDDLLLQLREYRLYKEVAAHLHSREEQGMRAYLRVAATPAIERRLDLSGVSLTDLVAAMRDVLAVKEDMAPADDVVAPVPVTIAEMIERIQVRLAQAQALSFREFLHAARSRVEVIVTFLAVLELIKAHRITVRQESLFGEIVIVGAEGEPDTAAEQQPGDQ